ncbi:hypothetical protein RI367_001114 [Sorochytrium milnesiophthora]
MGKKTTTRAKRRPGQQQPLPKSDLSADDLLVQIHALTEQSDFEQAYRLAQRALELNPNHLPALEAAATLCLELANVSQAIEYLNRYYQLDQSNDAIALYMGQIMEGAESVEWFRRAVALLEAKLSASPPPGHDERVEVTRKLADALCSVAEVYMTDLCFEPDAPQVCTDVLQRAISFDPTYPLPHQTLTSVLISLSEPEKARDTLLHSISLWLSSFQDYLSLISDPARHTEAQAKRTDSQPYVPPFESRISCVRLCIELGQYRLALEVLGICVQEFDESVEVWYLFGWLYYLLGEGESTVEVAGHSLPVDLPDEDSSDVAGRSTRADWWADAKECLEQARQQYQAQEYMDEPLREHVEQLLAAIRDSGVELPEPEVVDNDEMDDDDWRDVTDSHAIHDDDDDAEMEL